MKRINLVECFLLAMLILSIICLFVCLVGITSERLDLQILSVTFLLTSGLLANAIRLHQKSNL